MVRLKFRDPSKAKDRYGRYKFDPMTGVSLDAFPGLPSDYDLTAPREARDRTDKLLMIFLRSSERRAALELVPDPSPGASAADPEPEVESEAEPEPAKPEPTAQGREASPEPKADPETLDVQRPRRGRPRR